MTSSIRIAKVPGRQHWAQLSERGVYIGLRTALLIYRLFGRVGFSVLLYPLIGYFYLTGRTARRASKTYLNRVYEQPSGRLTMAGPPGWRDCFRHMMCFGEAILDKAVAWTGGISIEDVNLDDAMLFDEMCERGQGAVIIGSHLGNIAVCHALASRGLARRINVLVHTRHAETFNRLLSEISPASTMSLIQVTEVGPETAIMLRERISQGEFLVIVGDRTPPGDTSRVNWIPFLGHPAPFPQGPFLLATMLRCPVLTLFCFKGENRYSLHCEALCDTSQASRRERKQIVETCTRSYVARLERYCLQYPYQWFNFFDFWSQADPPSTAPGERT